MYNNMCEDEETKEDPDEQEAVVEENTSDDEDEFNSYILNLSTVQECYATPSALRSMSQVQDGCQSSSATLPL
jgi:hypothetical protein